MSVNSHETNQLLQDAAAGERQAWDALLARHQNRLRQMVSLRTDQRLQGQIDPSDLVQRAGCEAAARLPEYLRQPTMPFFLWLRSITTETLAAQQRQQLGCDDGSPQEPPQEPLTLFRGALPVTTTATLAAWLMGHPSRPTEEFIRAEMKFFLQEAINDLDDLDREVLVLRHFEKLSNMETAQVLNIDPSEASRRYVRALKRLNGNLAPRRDRLIAATTDVPTVAAAASPPGAAAAPGTFNSKTAWQSASHDRPGLLIVLLAGIAIATLATLAAVLGR